MNQPYTHDLDWPDARKYLDDSRKGVLEKEPNFLRSPEGKTYKELEK
jgi:hypothetical protein